MAAVASQSYADGPAAVESANIQRKIEKAMAEKNNDWTNLPKEHKLSQFAAALPEILEKAGYGEMYGVELVAPKDE